MRRVIAVLATILAVGAAPAGARDAVPAADAATGSRAAAWLRTRAALAEPMPFAHNAKAAEVWDDWAQLVDAGDLDGDNRGDVIDVRSRLEEDDDLGFRETLRLDAYRGSDGKLLWTKTLPTAAYVFANVTKVGLDGKPGVVVTAYEGYFADAGEGGAGAAAMTITSLDRTGTPLWARAFGLGGGYAPTGDAEGWAQVDGFLDAVAGGGTDVLVRTIVHGVADAVAAEERVSAIRFDLVDGATGVTQPLGAPLVTEDPDADSLAVGDLNNDKLDDVAVEVVTGGVPSLVGISTSTGAKLWEIPKYSSGRNRLIRLPDVTGDDRAEIGVWSFEFPSSIIVVGPQAAPPVPSEPKVVLVDGGRGTVLWRKTGTLIDALGNVDGRPGAEVVVGRQVSPRGYTGFTAEALTASGRRVWSVTRKVRAASGSGKFPWDGPAFSTVGDVHGDGVADVGYAVVSGSRRDEGTVNGRTGRVTRDPRKDMVATRAALDGRGADAYERVVAGGVVTVHAWRGDRPARLWSTAVRLRGFWLFASPVSVDGDKCGDLSVALFDGEGTFRNVVLAGATGRPLWTLERTGNANAKVAKPAVAGHRTYARGC